MGPADKVALQLLLYIEVANYNYYIPNWSSIIPARFFGAEVKQYQELDFLTGEKLYFQLLMYK